MQKATQIAIMVLASSKKVLGTFILMVFLLLILFSNNAQAVNESGNININTGDYFSRNTDITWTSGSINLGGGTMEIYGDLTINSGVGFNFNSNSFLIVHGTFKYPGNLQVNGTLAVDNDLIVNGSFHTNGSGLAVVNGDFHSYGGISSDGTLVVNGQIDTHGNTNVNFNSTNVYAFGGYINCTEPNCSKIKNYDQWNATPTHPGLPYLTSGTISHSIPGLYNFTVPAGVTQITVQAWGGGGGGSVTGGGGGGGAYASSVLTVTPGQQFPFTVGSGGTTGNNGVNSTFNTSVIIAAHGTRATTYLGASGGLASASTGNIKWSGGNGGNGGGTAGGGGGGSAYTNNNGGNGVAGSGSAGGSGGLGTGNGGIGGDNKDNGTAGSSPGGGGGGGGNQTTGGSGAPGEIIITWTTSGCTTPSAPTATGGLICIGSTATLSASGASTGQVYKWYSASTGGTLLKTSTDHNDNTFITPLLSISTNYWVSIESGTNCESARSLAAATFPSTSPDNQNTAGNNTWIGHVYDGTGFNTYYGTYTESETFNQTFGGNDECFTISSSLGSRQIHTSTFSVRYRMNSTRKGLYVVDLGSDDGSNLTIDGNLVYNNWGDQAWSSRPRVLINLAGNSSLLYDFYENGGANRITFENLTLVLENTLSANTIQTICLGNVGNIISGDTFGSPPAGISLYNTGYQWTYSTTPAGARTDIIGATGATFTPNTSNAPLNAPGSYYIYRNAILSSANNANPNPYIATNESSAAVITIVSSPITPTAASNSPVCTGATINLSTPAVSGATYAWTGPNGFASNLREPSINSASASNSGTYSVTITVAGCTSAAGTTTVTVNPTPEVNISPGVDDPKCPDLNETWNFNANSENYDAGSSVVIFKVTRVSPTNQIWQFNYSLALNNSTLDLTLAQPDESSASPINVDASEEDYFLIFYVINQPGETVTATLSISDIVVGTCTAIGIHSYPIEISPMPAIGEFK